MNITFSDKMLDFKSRAFYLQSGLFGASYMTCSSLWLVFKMQLLISPAFYVAVKVTEDNMGQALAKVADTQKVFHEVHCYG